VPAHQRLVVTSTGVIMAQAWKIDNRYNPILRAEAARLKREL